MKPETVQIWKDFSGRLRAVDFVELRPQVSGTIQEIRFEDGQIVNKGDILLVIDPSPYEAAAAQATADLQSAKNQLSLAQKELVRAEDLIKTEAISKRIYDERQNTARVAKSAVDAAEARLSQAKIDIDRAYVKAPITGRISRAELTVGNLVQAGGAAPLLTTIASNEGIYADFEVDEQTYLKNVFATARDREAQAKIPLQMILKADTSVTYDGVIQSFDNRIDPATGTIRARALFDNKDGSLLPGMFVSIRLGTPSNDAKIMVTEKAIGTDQNRKFVYVVGTENKVTYREVKLGETIDGKRIVTDGLQDGDKVITEGIMKMRPDMVVNPQVEVEQTAAATEAPSPETLK
jgi:multidrug efflux system membrane fusion protein